MYGEICEPSAGFLSMKFRLVKNIRTIQSVLIVTERFPVRTLFFYFHILSVFPCLTEKGLNTVFFFTFFNRFFVFFISIRVDSGILFTR